MIVSVKRVATVPSYLRPTTDPEMTGIQARLLSLRATRLDEGTEQYDRFLDLPFPLTFKVYLFNVENPDEILKGTAKPKLSEKGPYIYKQYRHKKILEIDEDEDTISYTQMETFEFDAESSAPLTEDDMITVLNPPLMSVYHLAEGFMLAGAVDKCIRPTFPAGYDEIFIKVPVRHLMFEGFNFCRNKGSDLCSLVNDIVCTIASTKRNSDILADYSLQFSFLNYKVREPDGKYTVKRGLDDIDRLGYISAWNGMKYTSYWGDGTTCSEVRGTDSTLYPPRITKDNEFYIFATDICRSVKINYIREETYRDVDGYMFGTDKNTLQPSTNNSEADCFCTKQSKDVDGQNSCFLDGVIDMQSCFGVPVLFSFPHFLWADEKYLNGVDGLSPNEEAHRTYLLVEPNTGTPLKGVKRIQLNAVIRPIAGIKSLIDTTKAVLPLLWIEEGVALTEEYTDELHSKYFDKVQILDGFKWALIAVSALLVVIFGVLVVRKRFFNNTGQPDGL
ncbi:hypothetical protein Zmor_006808 [Zophobas morio]|uniref:Sensory neuron membrane protein 2 n=1 Tax=Zophobas morio TaxID=2755281 RepID=A0AA38ISI6_9CUCU|nr:hypothetical protein Zmor_006808 [Zophobas morio]